jgi:RNA ligase
MFQLPNSESFKFKDCIVGGDECILINPINIKCKWDKDNLIFRSIILRKFDHKVISSSYKKFYNLLEQPDIEPFPKGPFDVYHKMDGSTLILGYHNDEYIERTRGTSNVSSLDNGHEIDFLRKKYPKLWVAVKLNPNYSILLEWETPTNYIVLRRVKEPTLTLTGVIDNTTLNYLSQEELDKLATVWGVDRPDRSYYDSIQSCVEDVEQWKGLEGVVIYSPCGQFFRKIKASEYLALHKMFSGMNTTENVLDVFLESPRFTKYSDFYNYIVQTMDFEIAERCKDDIVIITTAYSKSLDRIERVHNFVEQIRMGFSRKEQAVEICKHWNDYRKTLAFMLLDNKEITGNLIKNSIQFELDHK